jgi:hypothetical protein
MNPSDRKKSQDLDRELSVLRHLIEKENEMLRHMISSLDALEQKMTRSKEKKSLKKKKK